MAPTFFDPTLLRTFLAVADTLSFTRAAETLGITQPAVSQHVRRLETAAGRQLLVRDTRSVSLTDNGEAMRDMAEAGLGVAMLPGFIALPAITAGRLEEIMPGLHTHDLPITAVWPPVQPMPQKLRVFVDHLVAAFADGSPWQTPGG